jgi:hypothetical protein
MGGFHLSWSFHLMHPDSRIKSPLLSRSFISLKACRLNLMVKVLLWLTIQSAMYWIY